MTPAHSSGPHSLYLSLPEDAPSWLHGGTCKCFTRATSDTPAESQGFTGPWLRGRCHGGRCHCPTACCISRAAANRSPQWHYCMFQSVAQSMANNRSPELRPDRSCACSREALLTPPAAHTKALHLACQSRKKRNSGVATRKQTSTCSPSIQHLAVMLIIIHLAKATQHVIILQMPIMQFCQHSHDGAGCSCWCG